MKYIEANSLPGYHDIAEEETFIMCRILTGNQLFTMHNSKKVWKFIRLPSYQIARFPSYHADGYIITTAETTESILGIFITIGDWLPNVGYHV